MKGVSRFAVEHPKAIIFVVLALSVVGVVLLASFPVSILPDVTFPRLIVIAEAGDRPAELMTLDVVRPLEEAVATVRGVSKVRSKTQRGATEMAIDFAWGSNMLTAQQLVDSKINEARSQLPAETSITV